MVSYVFLLHHLFIVCVLKKLLFAVFNLEVKDIAKKVENKNKLNNLNLLKLFFKM